MIAQRIACVSAVLLLGLAGCQAVPTSQPATVPAPTPTPAATATPFSGSTRLDLDGISMYVEIHGQGNALLLLHGGMGSGQVWAGQVPVFSQQYRVVVPDSRGQGRTTDSEAPLSYHLMAEDTLQLMDRLGIAQADLVGWSDGAIIALDLAIHHPERVRALVAYGANASPDGLQQHVIDYLRSASTADLERDLGTEYLKLSPQPDHLPVLVEKIRTLWLSEPNFSPQELASIRAPALIMDGASEEEIRPGQAQAIAAAIPHARLVILPGVGHYAITQMPQAWDQVVLDFLKDK